MSEGRSDMCSSELHFVPRPAAEFLPGVIEFSESRVGVFEMANARMSSDTERLDSRRQDRHLEGERSPQLDESTFQDLVAFADQDQNVSAGRLLNAAPPEIRQIDRKSHV